MSYPSNKLLIENISTAIKDYRAHEGSRLVRIQPISIKHWITQFDRMDRRSILIEMDNIFQRRYCSKRKAKRFLLNRIVEMSEDFGYRSSKTFLKHCNFLNLQPNGKSQTEILSLLDEVIQDKFNMSLDHCGVKSSKYSIYLDDMLCTGTTLVRDLGNWANKSFSKGKTNLQAVVDGSTELILCYFFLHKKNYYKKLHDIQHKVSPLLKGNIATYYEIEIDNERLPSSKRDLIHPVQSINRQILKYQKLVNEQVNEYLTDKPYSKPLEMFYRPQRFPKQEEFFTSAKRRNRIEEIFLTKGIEILKKANIQKDNIRALGFSLPSERNFGFGTLCFTWRNISNNTPLVFWYSVSNFTPLFRKKEY